MITLRRCAKLAGLYLDQLVIGVALSAHHYELLKSYRLNLHRGRVAVRKMIVGDLLGYLDIGAQRYAADLLVVLRLFLSEENHITSATPRVDRRPVREPSALPRPFRANAAQPQPARGSAR